MIGSVEKDKLEEILQIPGEYVIDCVIALGYAAENRWPTNRVR